jgi:hypothetical protein
VLVLYTLEKQQLAWQWSRNFLQHIGEHAAGSKWL